jgi:hypothetical protein
MSAGTDGAGASSRPAADSPSPTLTDVQRLGMDMASRVMEGFVDRLRWERRPPPDASDGHPVDGHEPGFAQLRGNVARALDLYSDLVRRSFESYADLVEQRWRTDGVHLGGTSDGRTELLTLRGVVGDTRAAGTVWLHNTTEQPAAITLRLTDLTAHDGTVVAAVVGAFEPAAVRLCAGASVPVQLAIALANVAATVYRGYVLADGLPDTALPVELTVTDVTTGPRE